MEPRRGKALRRDRLWALLGVVLAIVGLGCAGKGDERSVNEAIFIQVTPEAVTLLDGQQQQFTATINGQPTTDVIWRFAFGETHGTITETGLHTAQEEAGSYLIYAQSKSDPTQVGFARVTVVPDAFVTIDAPNPVPLAIPRSRLKFSAKVEGTSDQSVSWSVDEGNAGGTITPQGVYTAPDSPGTYHVTATSNANKDRKATVAVQVNQTCTVQIVVEGLGQIDLHMATAEAPNTCANLVSLVNEGFYDGILFHRYEPGFVIQGGDPLTKTLPLDDPRIGTGGPGYTIPFEPNGLLHEKYALGMARGASKDSAGSQFYICLEAQPTLDGLYVVFGHVTAGQAVVDQLRKGSKIVSMRTAP